MKKFVPLAATLATIALAAGAAFAFSKKTSATPRTAGAPA